MTAAATNIEDTLHGEKEKGSPDASAALCKQCGTALDVDVKFCSVCGSSVMGDAPDPLVGRVVGERYRIVQLLGRGGMGVVYKCEHTRMGKIMAIKLLHGELARDGEVQRRFRREAQAASKLSHANTVSIFDFGTSDGLMYLVMEFVSGEDLGKILRTNGPVAPVRAAALAAQACGSLAEAHEAGIVHRDFKPENLLVSRLRDGRDMVKLLDFGLAKLREGEDRNEITSAGMLIGTPYYMAPEVIRSQSADHRVDIYALGAVLYRALTGTPPFTGSSPVAVLTRALTDELVAPSKKKPELGIPESLDAIVLRCMARDPKDRPRDAEEVKQLLEGFLRHEGAEGALLRDSSMLNVRPQANASGLFTTIGVNATAKKAVATRDEFEAFERRLRRGRRMATAAIIGLGAVIVSGTGFAYKRMIDAQKRARDTELEENNSPERATPIAADTQVRGRIGVRLARDRGDVDFYRLAPIPPGQWSLRAELDSQPNVDSEVELLRSGVSTAVATADDRGVGGREVIAGFRVTGGEPYYLSVHEHIGASPWPTENVSDTYTLRYTLTPVAQSADVEPNDREELALPLAFGASTRGWVESKTDADWRCLSEQPGRLRVRLEPSTGIDLELVVHPRDGGADRVIDETLSGQAETVVLPAPGPGVRPPCVIVRASTAHPPTQGDPDGAYQLRTEAP